MIKTSELSDQDVFFYYGQNDIDLETQSDLLAGIVQDKNTMFYDRSYGVGLKENYPNSFILGILTPYYIIKWIGTNNSRVNDGNDGGVDRRIASSQNAIDIEQEQNEMRIVVNYIRFAEYSQIKSVSTPLGDLK